MNKIDIKQFRKRLELNTKDFGALFGVSPRTVEGWEQGLRSPNGTLSAIINRAIGLSEHDLVFYLELLKNVLGLGDKK